MQLWSKLGGSGVSFVVGRMRRLLVPSLTLLAVWVAIATVAEGVFHAYWFGRAALLIVSPLWFIAVYLALVDGDRILAWCFVWGGLLGLVGLVLTNIYPPSMVGVPGDRISNMGPPTLCIVALCFFQTGLVLLVRPWILERLRRPGWAQANEVVNRFALPLFLFYTTGWAIAFALLWLTGYRPP